MVAKGDGGCWGRDGLGVWDEQMQAIIYRMDEQQGPTVEHRELYSISCDKPEWKRIFEKRIDTCICIIETLCYTLEPNTTLLIN